MSLDALIIITTIGIFLILFGLSIFFAVSDFKYSKILCIISSIALILYIISILLIPTYIEINYNKNKIFTEDIVATYELLSEENEKYITISGGKFNYPYVCYADSNGTIKTLKIDEGVKVVRNSDEAKLQEVKVKWGIIRDTSYVLYLPD